MQQRDQRPTSPAVIYIGGMLRSGTSLLGQLLGNVDGCLAAGELRHCWAVFAANTPCSCGRPARECPVWAAALRDALGPAADPALYEQYSEQAARVLRPRLALTTAFARPRADVDDYRELMVRLVRSVAARAHAGYVVDSSKSVTDFLFWARSPLPVHLVHIYRPAAAVAYSEARRVHWPDDVARYAPPSRPLAKSALRWSLTNSCVSVVAREAASYTLIRYDDLISDPQATLEHILRKLPGFEDLRIDTLATSNRGHLVSGNPSSFAGPVVHKPDEAWKRDLSASERALVASLTAPVSAMLHVRRRRLAPLATSKVS